MKRTGKHYVRSSTYPEYVTTSLENNYSYLSLRTGNIIFPKNAIIVQKLYRICTKLVQKTNSPPAHSRGPPAPQKNPSQPALIPKKIRREKTLTLFRGYAADMVDFDLKKGGEEGK